MKEIDFIAVPLSYEYLLSHLFGKDSYHGHVGALTVSAWKKDMRKILKYIRKSIVINVNTDQLHSNRLLKICDSLDKDIKKANSINAVSVSVIEDYTKLIFMLLGNSPNHWHIKSPYRDKNWQFSGHRTLTYTQNDEQKSCVIINAIDIKKLYEVKVEDCEDLHDVLYRKYKSNYSEFLLWFKKNHPGVYCELF